MTSRGPNFDLSNLIRGRHQGEADLVFLYSSKLIILKFSGNATFDFNFISQKRYFLEKVIWGCHVGATFARLRSPTSEAEIFVLIWCFLIGHKSGYLQEFGKPCFCYENIFYEPESCFQPATSTLSGFNLLGNDASLHREIQNRSQMCCSDFSE